jgi:hypothetical protein
LAKFWAIFYKLIWSPCLPGLPDGLFSNKNANLGKFCMGLSMENVGKLNWSILQPFGILHMWPFGTFYGHLVYVLFPFW